MQTYQQQFFNILPLLFTNHRYKCCIIPVRYNYYFYKTFAETKYYTTALKQKFRQGITLQGQWNFISFIFIIGGIVLMSYPKTFYFGVPLVVLLLPVLLSIRGTDIDYSEKTFRKWIWYYGFKIGKTISLDGYTFAELRNYYACHTMGCESISGTYTAKTFEILLGGPNKPKIIFTEIPNYATARKALDELCAQSGLELIDSYEAMIDRVRNLPYSDPGRMR